jgi:hypothetical protein
VPTTEYPYRDSGWEKQIYPMPSFPVLIVSDLEASLAWYLNVLGFAEVFTMRLRSGHGQWALGLSRTQRTVRGMRVM